MSQILPRAFLFAVLALIAWTILSMIAVLMIVGSPQPGEAITAYQTRVAGPASQVDMIVGAIVMLGFGFLVARPFAGRTALRPALVFALLYIAVEAGSSLILSGAENVDYLRSLPTFAIKLVAALIGGWLAGRTAAPADPGGVSLDKP